MKNFLKILLFVSFFVTPLITNAQRNKTKQEESIIWRSGTYPFTETRITETQQKEKLDSLVNNSEYIVKGSIIYKDILTFADENGKIWRICPLEIHKKIKGDIHGNKIYFMYQSHSLYYDPDDYYKDYYKELYYKSVPDYISFQNGIFFMNKTEMPAKQIKPDTTISQYNIYSYYDKSFSASENMSQIYEPTDLYQWGIGLNTFGLVNYYEGPYKMKFSNDDSDVYDYLIERYNMGIPGYSKTSEKKELQDSLVYYDSIINNKEIFKIESTEEHEDIFKTWLYGGRTIDRKLLQRSSNTVNCQLLAKYQHLECNDTACFYVFDLNCKYASNNIDTVFPDNILLYFEYNNKAFNTNIVSQGNLNLICNSPFFDTTYYELTAIDHPQNNNQVAIRLTAKVFVSEENGSFQTYAHRRSVPVNEEFNICQVRIRVPVASLKKSNIDYQKVGVKELWEHLDLNFNFWANSVGNVNPIYLVDTISLDLNNSYIMGKVDIRNVVPLNYDHIWGGGDCQVKITGKGFMDRKKISSFNTAPVIEMRSSDNCNSSERHPYIPLDWTDIQQWTDTCIIFNMPSVVYGKDNAINKTIGTSNVKIINQVNKLGYSEVVNVEYSIYNTYTIPNILDSLTNLPAYQNKKIPYWARFNCKDQIQFEVHSSITDTYIKNIQKAFDEWNNVLGFTLFAFKLDENGNVKRTSTNGSYADSISVIYYSTSSGTEYAGVLSQAIIGKQFLDSCQGKYIRREIDMFINNANMNELTNQQQIHTFLHELGHGIGLGHVLNKGDNMYPTDTVICSSIQEGTASGALKLFGISDTITWTCPNIESICSETTSCIPETPSITSVIAETNNSLIINWTPKNQVTSYTLKRSLNANMSPCQTVTLPANIRCFQDMDLTTNTTYYYQICANNANGSSAYSNIKSGTPNKNSIPNKNNSLNVQNNGTTSISINWSEEPSATEVEYYILERQEDSGQRTLSEYKIVAVLDANTHYYNDYDIEEGVNYSYRLRYITSGGVSQYSTPVSITPSELNEHVVVLPISRNALLYKNELESYSNEENTNYNNSDIIQTWRWTHSGMPTYKRSLFDIDLSQIPEDAIIESAQLELKGVDHMTNLTEHSSTYKSNASWLELVTEYWNEAQVTWNTQPASSSTYRVSLANSSSRTQNYSADITELVERMVVDTSVHGFMLRLQNETPYARMTFASPTYSVDSLRPYVVIRYITTPLKTLEIHPQKDAIVYQNDEPGHVGTEHSYFGDKETILAESWTFWGYQYYVRGLLGFDLSSIPSNAKVFDATLDLYSPYPQSDETYKHYSYLITNNQTYKSNASYLRCITEDWGENTTTWLNQPACDTLHQVLLPQSTSYSQDYLGIRIDSLIQRMIANPESTHGLMMELQNETNYARMVFASSDFPDPTLHPKLTVHYKVYPSSRLKSYNDKLSKTNDYKSYKYLDVKTEREFIDSLPIVNVSITPNPSHGQFYVNSDSPIQRISVYTNSLVIVKDIYVDEKDCKKKLVDLRKNKRGVYIIKIETQNGITTKEVILK